MNYKRVLFIWLVMVVFSGELMSQAYTDHIVKSFKMTQKSSVEVSNKYGKVHVQTWDKDSVRFIVDVRLQTTNTQKLHKLKNQINFDFTSTNYYIVAKTEFNKTGGVFSDMVESLVPSNTVTINFMVFLPKSATLNIENKFGDVYIDDFYGNLDVNLSNGNLKGNYLKGNTSIDLVSGGATVYKIDKGSIKVGSSDFEIREAGNLNIESRSSRIEIRKAEKVRITSKYDKYFIDEIKEISGDGYFTSVHLSKLRSELSSTLKYGEISIENILSTFSLINVNSTYTDIELQFAEGAQYNLDITHISDAHLTYPSGIKKLETKELGDKMLLTYGLVGANTATNVPKVKIVAEKKCYINIIHR